MIQALFRRPHTLRPFNVAEILFRAPSDFFHRHGYWTVFLGVLLENAGLPVPGETALLFAGFLAYQGQIDLKLAIATAIAGATIGDSLGYVIGRAGGTALVRKYRGRLLLSTRRFDRAQAIFMRHGQWAVFVARFITGLRVIAGPLAGAFLMPYRRFLVFNFAGAVVWAITIGWAGFAFGSSWERLVHLFRRIDILTLAVILAVAAVGLVYFPKRRRPVPHGKPRK